jgi:hypothetical protein
LVGGYRAVSDLGFTCKQQLPQISPLHTARLEEDLIMGPAAIQRCHTMMNPVTLRQQQLVIARQLWFTGERQVEVRTSAVGAAGELLAETLLVGGAGTELLVYRGQIPQHGVSMVWTRCTRSKYPLQYGYACVGRVIRVGAELAADRQDKLVLRFSRMPATLRARLWCHPLPADIDAHDAVFFANMETAVNLIQDGAPVSECRVFGQSWGCCCRPCWRSIR